MKALILAAGLGTRLRPLTNIIPKCLVPIANKPLLEYHFDRLLSFGITEVCVNTHYLSEKVVNFIDQYKNKHPEFCVFSSYEENLLGSAGTLSANQNFFNDADNFFVIYGDNLTDINYDKFLKFHQEKKGVCSIACYYEPHPESKGIVVFNPNKEIVSFVEKPKPEQINSHFANAGIYIVSRKIFDYLSAITTPYDFSSDLFPKLLNSSEKMFAYLMDEFLLDIGTNETYDLAQIKIKELNI